MSMNVNNISICKFNNICRACSQEGDLISLYENVYLIEMLKSCAQIQIKTNDGLPKQICLTCIENLNQAYTFTFKCKMVDAAFRKCITEHNLLNMAQEEALENKELLLKEELFTEKSESTIENNDELELINNKNDEISVKVESTEFFKIRRIVCDKCQKFCENITELINHQISEKHYSNDNSCPDCKETFITQDGLISHLNTHIQTIYEVQRHRRKGRPRKHEVSSQHNVSDLQSADFSDSKIKKERVFTCQICQKTFNNLSNLRRHELIHSDIKRFACTICNKSFRHSGTLITHQRMHTGEKPCVCDICGKTYIDLSTLGRHKKIHLGEKRFECDVCKKRFTQSGDLNVHKRLHTEKPYVCDICQKRFNRMTHILKHRKVHLKAAMKQIDHFLDDTQTPQTIPTTTTPTTTTTTTRSDS